MMSAPSIDDVRKALKPLVEIPVPYGNHEGDPVNCDLVRRFLSPEHQSWVRHAEEITNLYARTVDGQANRRAVNTLIKNGFPANLGPSQYASSRLAGSVTVGDWHIDIS